MTPLPDEDGDRTLASSATGERTEKHDAVVRAVRTDSSGRMRRLDEGIGRVLRRDAELLDRLGKA